MTIISAKPALVTLDELEAGNSSKVFPSIETAFGKDSLGLIVVQLPVDHKYHFLRNQLLGLAAKVAQLPASAKKLLEHKNSYFMFGWSHGKELFDGVPDVLKGSFYAQIYERETYEPEFVQKFPFYAHPNIWPSVEAMNGLDLEDAFISLGRCMTSIGTLLAKRMDEFLATKHENLSLIEKAIASPLNCHKGRLLYYFPKEETKTDSQQSGSWCGLHLDHSMLTGLTRAIFDPDELQSSDESGLYVQRPDGEMVKVSIPEDCVAFQVGEAAQTLSKGVLRATPHLVKGTNVCGVSRSTFACFLQPEMDFDLGGGLTFGKFTETILETHYESGTAGPVML